jgi:DNA-binding transcriptional LysR family regulator
MLTVKQIEAFYWVARLGTLSRAAERLHITQSAATKRLQEVESITAAPLFESNGRKNALTLKGREMVRGCEELLSLLDQLDAVKKAARQPARIVHVGLTELTALTWFPRFIAEVRKLYPEVTIQPEIDLSSLLLKKLEAGKLDLAFLPDPPPADGLVCIELGAVPFGWFAAPATFEEGLTYSLKELAAYPVIEQGANSIITELCARLWETAGVQPHRVHGGDNVNALAGLISAGVGISCLPVAMFEQSVRAGRLQMVMTRPEAPTVSYYCCFLKDMHSALGYGAADLARRTYSLEHGLVSAGSTATTKMNPAARLSKNSKDASRKGTRSSNA